MFKKLFFVLLISLTLSIEGCIDQNTAEDSTETAVTIGQIAV
jgi:hypothetical protein